MLSPRQRQVLTLMRDLGEELVYERGIVYVGLERTSPSVLKALLVHMAVSLSMDSQKGGFERYTINETGRQLLG